LNSALPQIQQSLTSIKARQPLRIAVTGYYDPFGALAPQYGFSSDEITWYRDRIVQLGTALKQLAAANNAVYVDITSLDAATGDVIQGNPATTYGFAHPTAQGQTKIAKAVLKALGL
jgi:lysophospholipase L1-like esterase